MPLDVRGGLGPPLAPRVDVKLLILGGFYNASGYPGGSGPPPGPRVGVKLLILGGFYSASGYPGAGLGSPWGFELVSNCQY